MTTVAVPARNSLRRQLSLFSSLVYRPNVAVPAVLADGNLAVKPLPALALEGGDHRAVFRNGDGGRVEEDIEIRARRVDAQLVGELLSLLAALPDALLALWFKLLGEGVLQGDRGLVRFANKVVNQRGEVVLEYNPLRLLKRKRLT